MGERYDIVVIGAGHNGLVAASLLAKKRRVLVVEQLDRVGGLAASEEIHPGYRTAGILPDHGAVRPWIVERLDLERLGFAWADYESPTLVPQAASQSEGLLLNHHATAAYAELSRLDERDAQHYLEFRQHLEHLGAPLARFANEPPPPLDAKGIGDLWSLVKATRPVRKLPRSELFELMRLLPQPLSDLLEERFSSPLLCAALASPALQAGYVGPRSPGTAANLLFAAATRGRLVKGSGGALVEALKRRAEKLDLEIRTACRVQRVVLDRGKVRGVELADGDTIDADTVAATCDPKSLFFDLLDPAWLGERLERDVANYRCRGTTAVLHLALAAFPEPACRPEFRGPRWRIGESLDELERAFDAVKYRRLPEKPMLEVYFPSLERPELAPENRHVMTVLAHFVPYDLEGGWSEAAREQLTRTVCDTLEQYAPTVSENIVQSDLLTPVDIERRYGTSGGHLFHGEHSIDQLLIRPLPQCARYATPFAGLFLVGSGSHPGGGLSGAPGGIGSQVILRSS